MEYSKNSQTIFDELIENKDFTLENAKRLKASCEIGDRQISPSMDNPSTTVYELVEVLNNLQNKSKKQGNI